MQRDSRRAGIRSSQGQSATEPKEMRVPECIQTQISQLIKLLEDIGEPDLTPDVLRACVDKVQRATGSATLSTDCACLAAHALALRRSAQSTSPDDGPQSQYKHADLRHGMAFGLLLDSSKAKLYKKPIALTCVRGDALLAYMSLLAQSAAHLRAHARLRQGPTDQPHTSRNSLPKLPLVMEEASRRVCESLLFVQVAGYEHAEMAKGGEIDGPGPLPSTSTKTANGSGGGAGLTADEAHTLQLLQQGMLDGCCRVLLEALPLARSPSLINALKPTVLFRQLLSTAVKVMGSFRGLWLGSAAALLPVPSRPPLGCVDAPAEKPCSSSSGTHSGSRNSSSSRLPAASAFSRSLTGQVFPSALKCLLAAHVVRLCAALDGGPTYGLLGDSPGGQGDSPGGEGAFGGGGAPSPLAEVPLLDGEGVAVLKGSVPQVLSTKLAADALEMWMQARELWEGSVVRDAWNVLTTAEAAAGTQQPGSAGASSSRGTEDISNGTWRRRATAAVKALRHRLAEAASGARAGGTSAAATVAAGAEEPGAEQASGAGTSSSSAAAPTAVTAEAAGGGVAALHQMLAALEVEAAAERLPPLNRTATVELCRRLVAAIRGTLGSSPARHRFVNEEAPGELIWRSLHCWRLLALAPERLCPVRPAPPAAVRRLEAWWQAALEAMGRVNYGPEEIEMLVGVVLSVAGFWGGGDEGEPVTSLYCGPCLAPLPASLPAGPHPDVAAALSADLLHALIKDYRKDTEWSVPALLLSSMQRQHGGWCDAAMFGHVADLTRVVDAAAARLEMDHMRFTAALAHAAAGPAAAGAEAPLYEALNVVVALLDSQLLSCLLRLAGLCVNTQPPVDGSAPGAHGARDLPGSSTSAPSLAAASAREPRPGPVPSPVSQLGRMVSYTAAQLLPRMVKCLLAIPRGRAATEVRGAQCAAGWLVQWLLLLLQVAMVDGRAAAGAATLGQRQAQGQRGGRQGQAAVDGTRGPGAVEEGERQGQEQQGEGPRPALPMAAAWRRQLLQQLDLVGALCGVVRLLAAYPRGGGGVGVGEGGLRDLVEPRALAACLDAAAAAFPERLHSALCGQDGQGQGAGGFGGRAALVSVRVLLSRGGALELDGGAWVGSRGSCFWAVVERGPGGAGVEAVEKVVREAEERAGHVVGLVVPSAEVQPRVLVKESASGTSCVVM